MIRNAAIALSAWLFLASALPTTAEADSITIGWPPPDTNSANGVPFGMDFDGVTYQQIYNAALFPGVFQISGITFFNTLIKEHPPNETGVGIHTAQYEFRLSTTPRAVNGLSWTDLPSNVGSNETLFASVFLSGPVIGDTLTIPGGPYRYDPSSGNLLLQISKLDAQNCECSLYFDARNGTFGNDSSRAYDEGYPLPSHGLITRFEGQVDSSAPIPEPTTVLLVGAGTLGLLRRARQRRIRDSRLGIRDQGSGMRD